MTNEPDGPFTEEDEQPLSEYDTAPETGDEEQEEAPPVATPAPAQPLTPATPRVEPPLWTPTEMVSVRVERDGFAMVNGKRVFIARSLAGGRVKVPKAWGQ